MKKVLMFIGAGALVAILALVIFIASYAPKGMRLDRTSKEYAVRMVEATIKNWDINAIKAESSEELLKSVPENTLAKMLQEFSERLGPIKSHGEPKGQSFMRNNNLKSVTTANYVVPVSFEKGDGEVALRFILKENETWKLLAVNVNSSAFYK